MQRKDVSVLAAFPQANEQRVLSPQQTQTQTSEINMSKPISSLVFEDSQVGSISPSQSTSRARSRTLGGETSVALFPQDLMQQLTPQLASRRSAELLSTSTNRRSSEMKREESTNQGVIVAPIPQTQQQPQEQEKQLSPKRRLTEISSPNDTIYPEAKKTRLSEVGSSSSGVSTNVTSPPTSPRPLRTTGKMPSSPMMMVSKQQSGNNLNPVSPTHSNNPTSPVK